MSKCFIMLFLFISGHVPAICSADGKNEGALWETYWNNGRRFNYHSDTLVDHRVKTINVSGLEKEWVPNYGYHERPDTVTYKCQMTYFINKKGRCYRSIYKRVSPDDSDYVEENYEPFGLHLIDIGSNLANEPIDFQVDILDIFLDNEELVKILSRYAFDQRVNEVADFVYRQSLKDSLGVLLYSYEGNGNLYVKSYANNRLVLYRNRREKFKLVNITTRFYYDSEGNRTAVLLNITHQKTILGTDQRSYYTYTKTDPSGYYSIMHRHKGQCNMLTYFTGVMGPFKEKYSYNSVGDIISYCLLGENSDTLESYQLDSIWLFPIRHVVKSTGKGLVNLVNKEYSSNGELLRVTCHTPSGEKWSTTNVHIVKGGLAQVVCTWQTGINSGMCETIRTPTGRKRSFLTFKGTLTGSLGSTMDEKKSLGSYSSMVDVPRSMAKSGDFTSVEIRGDTTIMRNSWTNEEWYWQGE